MFKFPHCNWDFTILKVTTLNKWLTFSIDTVFYEFIYFCVAFFFGWHISYKSASYVIYFFNSLRIFNILADFFLWILIDCKSYITLSIFYMYLVCLLKCFAMFWIFKHLFCGSLKRLMLKITSSGHIILTSIVHNCKSFANIVMSMNIWVDVMYWLATWGFGTEFNSGTKVKKQQISAWNITINIASLMFCWHYSDFDVSIDHLCITCY